MSNSIESPSPLSRVGGAGEEPVALAVGPAAQAAARDRLIAALSRDSKGPDREALADQLLKCLRASVLDFQYLYREDALVVPTMDEGAWRALRDFAAAGGEPIETVVLPDGRLPSLAALG